MFGLNHSYNIYDSQILFAMIFSDKTKNQLDNYKQYILKAAFRSSLVHLKHKWTAKAQKMK